MPDVRGFPGVRFDPGAIGSLDDVITPPYDVITPEERRELARRSVYSMVHLILPEARAGLTGYEAAARDLAAWVAQGVLKQDPVSCFYLLDQTFLDALGVQHVRRGFLGVARVPEAGDISILGHEQTFPNIVADRLRLTEATRANLGPVFVLYSDADGRLAPFLDQARERAPVLVAHTIDGVTQRLWCVPHTDAVTAFFRDKRLYIADGHHRFRSACAYRDRMRATAGSPRHGSSPPYEYVLMGFVSLSDPGLHIYPTHRLLHMPRGFRVDRLLSGAANWFTVTPVAEDLAETVVAHPGCAFGIVIHGAGQYLLSLPDIDRVAFLGPDRGPAWRDLDVAVLHRGVVERIMGLPAETYFVYERDASKVLAAVHRGDYGLGFILKATTADQIRACAEAGESMPHKSTYFFPKLPSGAVLHFLS